MSFFKIYETFIKLLKKPLPKTLFGRAILIIITPVIFTQLVSIFGFYETHWQVVSLKNSNAIINEISLIADTMAPENKFINNQEMIDEIQDNLNFKVTFFENEILKKSSDKYTKSKFSQLLSKKISYPFQLQKIEGQLLRRNIYLYDLKLQFTNGVVQLILPKNRFVTSSMLIFLSWMIGSALVTLAISIIFMRNQIRPIKRLADASEAFGKGEHSTNIKVEGANEVKQAARAFNMMRQRIIRQIQQRTTMLAGVSHDLRTPLTRMKLQLEFLPDSENIQALRLDLSEMEQMIDEYLAFAKGQDHEKPSKIKLKKYFETIIDQYIPQKIDLTLKLDKSLNTASLTLKPNAFKRCINNLINNAKNFGDKIILSINHSKHAIDIIIDDNGCGIPAAHQKNVFNPFYRLDRARNPNQGNIGLGLTIARDIVHDHGGEIKLDKSPMGGLRVKIQLPK